MANSHMNTNEVRAEENKNELNYADSDGEKSHYGGKAKLIRNAANQKGDTFEKAAAGIPGYGNRSRKARKE